eukprot:GHVU01137875.1.p1 GENE.GHVU01137875.1~~GHVU01137875.1.p1  ORF type:complete len:204 (+),score=11.57 GHVU01137875.1:114-725(+)
MLKFLNPELYRLLESFNGRSSLEFASRNFFCVHASHGGTTARAAENVFRKLAEMRKEECCKLLDVSEFVNIFEALHERNVPAVVVFFVGTYAGGQSLPACESFFVHLDQLLHDFRVSKDILKGIEFFVIGFGDRAYGDDFCRPATVLDGLLWRLGARRIATASLACTKRRPLGTHLPNEFAEEALIDSFLHTRSASRSHSVGL